MDPIIIDELRKNQLSLDQMFEHLMMVVSSYDVRENKLYCSVGVENLSGYTIKDFVDRPTLWKEIVLERDQDILFSYEQELLSGISSNVEYRIVRSDGEVRWIESQGVPVKDEAGEVICIYNLQYDITKRKQEEQKMKFMAYHDELTGLPNRKSFQEYLPVALEEAKKNNTYLAVVFLDLDQFKWINDSYGHVVGDQLLQLIAQRLQQLMDQGTVVSRFGGDEFILLFPHLSEQEEMIAWLDKLLTVSQSPLQVEGREFCVTASIGVAFYPMDGTDEATLLKHADRALYVAKHHGKNQYQLYSKGMAEAALPIGSENEFLQAMEKGEFRLFYQPQINLATGNLIGMEALIRWQHPQYGLLYPDQFLPVAEEIGFDVRLGEWVISQACLQHTNWRRAGYPPLKIAINLSQNQFNKGDIAALIGKIIKEKEMEPRFLELEITEKVTLDQPAFILERLEQLKELGVSIALDNFGAYYHTFHQLKGYPIDTIKMDRSLIKDLLQNNGNMVMTKAMIELGHHLNLTVIAEGVEELQQLPFLIQNNCDAAQGFYYSQPMSAEEIEEKVLKLPQSTGKE